MQSEIQNTNYPNYPNDNKDNKDNKDKKIKRLFGEFVETPTPNGLARVMRRANRVIAGTLHPAISGPECNTDHSWLISQFAVWNSVSVATSREEIIYNFKDIAYHLKSIYNLSRRGLLSYSTEERRMYSEVLHYYACILSHVFLVSGNTESAAAAPATNTESAAAAPATNTESAAAAPATNTESAAAAPVHPPPSAPIPIPARVQRRL